jgi:hypothetical protein
MRILIAALLSVALIWLAPAKQDNSNINNIVPKTANVEQRVKPNESNPRRSATQEIAPLQEKTPEPPGNLLESTARQVKPAVPSETGCETYRPLLEKYNWDVHIALAVMQAESGCNPTSLSQTSDRGLMQINAVHADMVNGNLNALFDPATNIQVAHRVYLSQGWKGWSAYNNGSYLKFL